MRRSLFRTAPVLVVGLAVATTWTQEPAPPPVPPPHPPEAHGQDARSIIARQVIEHLRQNEPQTFRRLMQLRKDDQAAFAKELHAVVKAWRARDPKRRPPVTPEERLSQELSQRYHEAKSDEERDAIRRELAAAVEQAFEARVKVMEGRVQRLEQELAKFNERLEQLKENRKTICEDRVQELLRPPELDWEGDW